MTNSQENNSIQTIAYCLIILISFGWLLHIGSSLIIPFIFAVLLAVFLYPIDKRILRIVKLKWLSIIFSFLVLILPILIITTLFSYQLMNIAESLPTIGESMQTGVDKIFSKINSLVPFLKLDSASIFESNGGTQNLHGPLKFIGQGLLSTTEYLASLGMMVIYTFFILYYRNSFKNFIIYQFDKSSRPDIKEGLSEIKETIQSYIGGLGLVIAILSILNSIGLALIGIEYAIFWGVLAGMLAIIPYIGTLLGGFLPFIYALSTADAQWQPIAVVVYYLFIQQVEGNFITPKIVGDKVDINPLVAILSLVFLGSFWGLGGIILALPMVSILKIILSNFESTLPYAILMSSDISKKKGIFKKIAQS
jgi:predicted PurR-regulated permease PerM